MGRAGVDETVIHDILSNKRRREAIKYLIQRDEAVSVRELARHIARLESESLPPPGGVEQSVYVSLKQNHIPRLNELDIIEYDRDSNEVSVSRRAKDCERYMVEVEGRDRRWGGTDLFLLVAGVLGGLTALAASVDAPYVSLVDVEAWLLLFAAVVFVVSLYRVVGQNRLPGPR